MSSALIISGEASETDSEDENPSKYQMDLRGSIKGALVLGEDSESDNEADNRSIASALSASHLNEEIDPNDNVDVDSLFQQKLREFNTNLYSNMESLLQTTANEATKGLNSVEHQLLKSQIALQGAVTSLKALSVNSLTLKSKLHSLLSSKFLPNIRVNVNEQGNT